MSSKEQELEGYSLEAQERYLRDYCIRCGLRVAKVFYISESASKADQRKTFNEAMAYMKRHHILHFVCEKVDRLLRNFKDTVMVEEWLAAEEDRRLHLPKNSLVLHRGSSSQDKFVWGMHVVVAKNYTDNLSEEVRKGQLEKLRRGWLPGVPPPGYENVTVDGKRIQRVIPELATKVIQLFEAAATRNYTLTTLTWEAADIGLLDSTGKPLTRSMIHRMLRNPYYTGVIVWNGETYSGSQEPIISNELFNKAQAATCRVLRDGPRQMVHAALFKGLITCADCHKLVVWEIQKGHWYGKCRQSRKCPRRGYIREEVLNAQVVGYLRTLKAPSPQLVTWLREGLEEVLSTETAGLEHTRSQLAGRDKRLALKRDVLYEDRLEGRISAEQFDMKSKSLVTEQREIDRQIKSLESGDTAYLKRGVNFLQVCQSAADEYSQSRDVDKRRDLLAKVFDGLVLQGNELRADFNQRAQWAVDLSKTAKIGSFEPSDFGSTKQKSASGETLRSSWLAALTTVRTLFQ